MSARCLRLGPLGVRRLGAAFTTANLAAKLQSISRPCIFAAGSRICRYSTVTPVCVLGSDVVVADLQIGHYGPQTKLLPQAAPCAVCSFLSSSRRMHWLQLPCILHCGARL